MTVCYEGVGDEPVDIQISILIFRLVTSLRSIYITRWVKHFSMGHRGIHKDETVAVDRMIVQSDGANLSCA